MYKKAVLINIGEAALDQSYWEQLDTLVEAKVLVRRDDPSLMSELVDCDCLLIGYQVDTPREVIDAAPGLKYIGILATAFGTVDLEHAASKNIPVTNLGGYSNESVAEFSIAILLWKMRNIQEGLKRAADNNFDETGLRARELRGSEFGVVGLGSIGGRVAEIAAGFGANVSYWSRTKKDVPYSYKDVIDLMATSDYVSVNVAESAETVGLITREALQALRPGSILVTTVPLSVIDREALHERLAAGDISFISDHGEELTAEERERFATYGDNATFLPAIAYISDEARQNRQRTFVENIEVSLTGAIQNRVN